MGEWAPMQLMVEEIMLQLGNVGVVAAQKMRWIFEQLTEAAEKLSYFRSNDQIFLFNICTIVI